MPNPILLTLAAAVSCAFLDILFRYAMKRDFDPYVVAWYNLALGGIIVLLMRPLPPLSGLSTWTALLLFISSLLWAWQAFCDVKAYQGLSASVNAVLNAAGFVLLNVAGVIWFKERLAYSQIVGVICILAAMFLGINFRGPLEVQGAALRACSVVSGAAALLIDKHLTAQMSPQLVLVSGYLTPALIMLCIKPSTLRGLGREVGRSWIVMNTSALLFAFIGFGMIYSIGFGQLGTTVSLYQMRVVFAFFLALIFLRERERLFIRSLSALLTILGAFLVAGN